MARPNNDTSEIRAWLSSQLKLEDIPEPIWDYLVDERYVRDARDPDYPDGRGDLVWQARKLLKLYSASVGAPNVPRKQRTSKRQRATTSDRALAAAEIATKIAKARASKNPDASPNDDEEKSPIVSMIINNKITVTADPWVPVKDVMQAFTQLRNVWFKSETPSERRVCLCRFVVEHSDGYYDEEDNITGLRPTSRWRPLMEQWNQCYPPGHDWHYTDPRKFYRDFRETFEALTLFENF
jgi:hypothetical protein